MKFFTPMPDNERAFFSFINLVINNRKNDNLPADYTSRPKHFGPVKQFDWTRNEVGELWVVTYNPKDNRMIEMFYDQFCLLRTYWETIEEEVEYLQCSKYDPKV